MSENKGNMKKIAIRKTTGVLVKVIIVILLVLVILSGSNYVVYKEDTADNDKKTWKEWSESDDEIEWE